jgi:hypothetical protein
MMAARALLGRQAGALSKYLLMAKELFCLHDNSFAIYDLHSRIY